RERTSRDEREPARRGKLRIRGLERLLEDPLEARARVVSDVTRLRRIAPAVEVVPVDAAVDRAALLAEEGTLRRLALGEPVRRAALLASPARALRRPVGALRPERAAHGLGVPVDVEGSGLHALDVVREVTPAVAEASDPHVEELARPDQAALV